MPVPLATGDDQGVRKIEKKDKGMAEKLNEFFAAMFNAELKQAHF